MSCSSSLKKTMRGIVFTILGLCVMAPLWSQARQGTAVIARKASGAVVLIKGTGPEGETFGTGFLISSDGQIVTALHVVADLTTASVRLASGDTYDRITVLAYDERKDMAILKIPGFDLPHLDLGNSNQVAPGDLAVVIGNPQGLNGSVTAGIISAIRDSPGGGEFKVIQTDAAVNSGNSGGPLLNAQGQVVGVVTSKLRESENLNFAVPINYIRGLLRDGEIPIPLSSLVAKLGRSTATRDRGLVDAQGIVTELSYSQLKALALRLGYELVEEHSDRSEIVVKISTVRVVLNSAGHDLTEVLHFSDKVQLEPINEWDKVHTYVTAFQVDDGSSILRMSLWLGNGVTMSTVESYLNTFATAISEYANFVMKAEGKK